VKIKVEADEIYYDFSTKEFKVFYTISYSFKGSGELQVKIVRRYKEQELRSESKDIIEAVLDIFDSAREVAGKVFPELDLKFENLGKYLADYWSEDQALLLK